MRKSKNYYKFMEYMAFGISGWHEDAVMVDNGVIECVAYAKVAHIEDYSKLYECNYDKMAMDSDNTWLTIKCVLVNEEVINVYYVTNERNVYIGQLILDDYRTQKQALDAIHKKVVCFFLNSREFCEFHPTEEPTEEPTETAHTSTLNFEYRNLMYTDEYKAAHNATSTQEDERDRAKYLMETHSLAPTVNKRYSYKEVDKVCGDCSHFNACMQGFQTVAPTCCMFDSLYRSRKNPDWHNVSLATLANIDFDMLDKKRQTYLTLYRELHETVNNARKCKTIGTFDRCTGRLRSKALKFYCNNEISAEFYHFIILKLSMLNVEYGLYDSSMELATGLHESRRYNKIYCN